MMFRISTFKFNILGITSSKIPRGFEDIITALSTYMPILRDGHSWNSLSLIMVSSF